MAAREGIERAALDAVTLRSHHRARAAWAAGRFEASVIPVHSLDGTVALGADENVRDLGDGSGLATMRLAFDGVGAAGFDEIILEQRPELGACRTCTPLLTARRSPTAPASSSWDRLKQDRQQA